MMSIKTLYRDREILLIAGAMILMYALVALEVPPPAIARSYISVLYIYILAFTWSFMYALGYFPLSIAAFYGLGGYVGFYMLAALGGAGVPLPLAVASAIVAVAVASIAVSFLVSYSTINLRGPYFIILTFALGELFRNLFSNIEIMLFGITGRIYPLRLDTQQAVLSLTAVALASITLWSWITGSRMGIAIQMIRRDETLAEATGVDTFRVKTLVFMAASAIQAIVGFIMAGYLVYIEPQQVFSPYLAFIAPISALVGGASSAAGPLMGSLVMIFVSEQISYILVRGHLIVLGTILVALAIFVKKGLYDYIYSIIYRRSSQPSSST